MSTVDGVRVACHPVTKTGRICSRLSPRSAPSVCLERLHQSCKDTKCYWFEQNVMSESGRDCERHVVAVAAQNIRVALTYFNGATGSLLPTSSRTRTEGRILSASSIGER